MPIRPCSRTNSPGTAAAASCCGSRISIPADRAEHVDAIIEDLMWLGIEWDGEIFYQSERLALYAEALERLKRRGLVYPCFCTRADIAASTSAPHGPDGPIYPGTCRGRRFSEAELIRPHAWRLDMAKALDQLVLGEGRGVDAGPELDGAVRRGSLSWSDHGDAIDARPEQFGDVVLARKDAPTSYHLAVTVDDAMQGVSDIIRGRDLFAATHVHRLLQALLGLPTPRYHHHALLTGGDGQRLAKRNGAPTLADLRKAGVDPGTLAAGLLAGQLPPGYSTAR